MAQREFTKYKKVIVLTLCSLCLLSVLCVNFLISYVKKND
jgi:hypothetical protein